MLTSPALEDFMVWTTLLVLTSAAGSLQQTSPAWQFTSPDTIGAVQVTPFGTLAVQTGHGVVVLDIATGQTVWSRDDARAFDVIERSPYGVLSTDSSLELIDFETGRVRWSFGQLGLTWLRYIAQPDHGLILVYGGAEAAGLAVGALDIASGTLRWIQPDLFGAPHFAEHRDDIRLSAGPPILWDSDTTMVLSPNYGGPIKLDARTGTLLWRIDTLANQKPPDPRDRSGAPLAGEGRIFVPYGKRLLAVESETGRVIWNHHDKYNGLITQMELTPHGLLIRGRPDHDDPVSAPFLDLVDPATGASRWNSPLKHLDYATPFTVIGDSVLVVAKGTFWAVGLESGTPNSLMKLHLDGGDAAYALEVVAGGFLIASAQNMLLLDSLRREQYRVYYPAVGASLLAKLASTVLIVGLDVASVASAGKTGYAPMITNNPVLSARYRASRLAESSHFLFTSQKDDPGHNGFSFVRIDRSNGHETGRVWVTERHPHYVLDPASGTLFLLSGKGQVQALRF